MTRQDVAEQLLNERPLGTHRSEAVFPDALSGRWYASIVQWPWEELPDGPRSRALKEGDEYETHHVSPEGVRHVIYSECTWIDDDGVAYFRITKTTGYRELHG